jgi:hypothetical protein
MGAVRASIDRADFGFPLVTSRVPARAARIVATLLLIAVTFMPLPSGKESVTSSEVIAAPEESLTVVISQVYGGGQSSGSTYKCDYIELFNRGNVTVNLSMWSVQYAASGSSSNFSSRTNLTGTIAPGKYYLIQEVCGTTGLDLPTPEVIGSISMSATSAKVALVSNQTIQSSICPIASSAGIIDFVGYGTANCREGLAPVSPPSATTAGVRKSGGCTDTDENLADFDVATPNPRNASSPANTCSPTIARISSIAVTSTDSNTLIQWRTSYETDNLGFNIYREVGGERIKLNPSLVAGSALKGAGGASPAGAGYTWFDDSHPTEEVRYWLEDVDLSGTSTWHGPVIPIAAKVGQTLPTSGRSALLSEIGRSGADAAQLGGRARSTLARQSSQTSESAFDTPRWLASMPAAKLPVRNDSWYRVSRQQLADAGFDTSRDPVLLQMYADGSEVPIVVADWSTGSDSKDPNALNGYIEFYGTGLDTPTTDTHVYWLVNGSHPGRRVMGNATASSLTLKPRATPGSFPYTIESKPRTLYFSSLLNGDAENFFGPVISAAPVDQTLAVINRDTTEEQAQLEVAFQGVTMQAHSVSVRLNDVEVGMVNFMDREHPTATLPVDAAMLKDGDNIVSLVATGSGSDVSLLDAIRIIYAHTYRAESNALTLSAQGGNQVRVAGFSNPQIRVFDVTDPGAASQVEVTAEAGKGEYVATFCPQGTGTRTLIALSDNRVSRLTPVTVNVLSRWADYDTGADLLVIAHGSLIGSVQPLVELRKSEGLSVAVVDVEDAYDEFSYGLHKPQGVKELLRWAHDHWLRVPRFVLLVGDSSLDPRSYYSPPFRPPVQKPSVDLVPTRLIDTDNMETASDDALADFDGDGLAEMAVGRLPARTEEEADKMVARIVGYRPGGAPESALLVADNNSGYDFEGATTALRDVIPGSVAIEQVNRSSGTTEEVRTRIIEGINTGPQVVSFFGHGNVDTWTGAGLLTSADAARLQNREDLSLFVMMTCLNGYFQDPNFDSLAEALLKAPDGGAVAVWASSGMNLPDAQAAMDRAFIQAIYSSSSPTLGEAALEAKSSVSDPYARRTWVLLGDPSARIR